VQLSGTGVLGELLMEQIKTRLSFPRVRADTFGYLQRSFAGCISDRDAREAREVGEKAVQYAMWDDVDGSVVIRRPVLDYGVDYELVPLEAVAAKTKTMEDAFINEAGNNVTQAFHAYCRPLIGSSAPRHYRLRAPVVGSPGS
jgi:6-phosphofructokinase